MRLPPTPKAFPFLGHALAYGRDPFGYPLRCAQAYGDIVRIPFPGLNTYLVVHPDDIEQVVVKDHARYTRDWYTRHLADLLGQGLLVSDGEFWKRQRRLIQPAFHQRALQRYASIMVEETERHIDNWTPGATIDIHAEMMRLTLRIVARALLGVSVDGGAAATIAAAIEVAAHHMTGILGTGVRLPLAIPTPGNLRFRRAVANIDKILYQLIAERRAQPGGEDLLSMLLAARDDDPEPIGGALPLPADGPRAQGRARSGMTDRQLRDETVTLLLAGHETTALALTFALHLLAGRADSISRLEEEVGEILGDRPAAFEDAQKLRFTDAVIAEAMRLYPPAWAIGREAMVDTTIRDFDVPRGTQIMMMQWLTHRDPRWWDAPEEFRPERWENDLARRLPRFAYFPFGGGPRLCIGHAFAKLEAILLLSTITRRFRFARADARPLRFLPTVTLRPRDPVPMTLTARTTTRSKKTIAAQ